MLTKAKAKRECDLYLLHQVYVTLFTKYSTPRVQSSIWKSMKVSLGQIEVLVHSADIIHMELISQSVV